MADDVFDYIRNYQQGPAPTGPEVRTVQAPSAPGGGDVFDYIRNYGAQQKKTDQQILPPEVAAATETVEPSPTVSGPLPGQPQPGPTSPHASRGWWQTLSSSVERGVGQIAQVPKQLGAVYSEVTGEPEAAARAMRESHAAEAALPQPEWSLENVHNPLDFGYWLTERLGENAPALLGMLASGGIGSVSAALAARSLASASTRAALVRAGEMAGIFATTAPMGVASTAGEQFGVTGSTQPGISVPFGLAGGLLQTYLPMKLMGAMTGPAFAGSYLGAAAKGGLIGGGVGIAQEALNIYARKLTDPNYSYFGDGPERVGWGGRFWESLATNLALGATMGAGFHPFEPSAQKPALTPFRPEPPVPGEEPGVRHEEVAPAEPLAPRPPLPSAEEPGLGPWPPEPPAEGGPALPKWARGEVQPGEPDLLAQQQDVEQTELGRALTQRELPKEAQVQITPEGREAAKQPLEPLASPTDKGFQKLDEARKQAEEERLRRNAERVLKAIQELSPKTYRDSLLSSVSTNWRAEDQTFRTGMTPAQFLESEYLWGMADRVHRETGKPMDQAYMELANYVFEKTKPKGDWKLTLEMAQNEMARQHTEAGFQKAGIPGKMYLGGPRATPAHAPETATGATAPEPGPVTVMRRQIIKAPLTADRNLFESSALDPRLDAFGAMPLLRETISPLMDHEAMLDWMEAHTVRYAVEDPSYKNGFLPRLLTDTELEKLSLDYPQSQELRTWEIEQGSLQPGLLTADVFDLPRLGSERIWFLDGTSPEERTILLADYNRIQQAAEQLRLPSLMTREAERTSRQGTEQQPGLEAQYEHLIHGGLRVIPSRGSSFYYGGTFAARPARPTETSRSRQVVFYNPNTGRLMTGVREAAPSMLREEPVNDFTNGIPMAVDLNKFAPGEISGFSGHFDLDQLRFKQGIGPFEQQRIKNEVAQAYTTYRPETVVKIMQKAMREGAWFEPTKKAEMLITKEPLQLDKLTPGVTRLPEFGTADAAFAPTFREQSEIYVDPQLLANPEVSKTKVEMAKSLLRQALPGIDSILQKFGIDKRLHFELRALDTAKGLAYLDQGKIALDPTRAGGERMKDSKLELLGTLMHEVGHFITFHALSTMDSEVHTLLRYGYNRSLLDHRMQVQQAVIRGGPIAAPGGLPRNLVQTYFKSYSEWLAEQARRWALTAEEPRTLLERSFKDLAKRLERFYGLWETEVGAFSAKDMIEPSYHFSAAMQYLRGLGDRTRVSGQFAQSHTLHRMSADIPDSPVLTRLMDVGPRRALAEMLHMFPPGVQYEINSVLKPEYGEALPGVIGRTLPPVPGLRNFPLIELALGAMPRSDDVAFSRQFWTHELTHTYRMMGLMMEPEFRLLHRHAEQDGVRVDPEVAASLRSRLEKQAEAEKWSPEYTKWITEEATKEERVAQYLERFANGEPTNPEGHGIMARLRAIMEKIRNYFHNEGFQTREEVLQSIFDGEMAHRPDRTAERMSLLREMARGMREKEFGPPLFNSEPQEVPGHPELVAYKALWRSGQSLRRNWVYKFYKKEELARAGVEGPTSATGRDPGFHGVKTDGYVVITNANPTAGHDVSMIRTNDKNNFDLMKIMMSHWESDLGVKAKPSGVFTWQGYRMARLRWREEMKHYVWSVRDRYWYSPNFIRDRMEESKMEVEVGTGERRENFETPEYKYWKGLYDKVPKETWSNPILNEMYMLPKGWMRDEVQGAVSRGGQAADQSQVQASLGAQVNPHQDEFAALADRKQTESQARAARESELSYDMAAPRMPVMEMRRIIEQVEGYREDPEVSKKLTGIVNEADRIGKFTKYWWDIIQLLWNNEKIEGLRQYVGGVKLWSKLASYWQTRADETIKGWRQLPAEMREKINDALFYLAEMHYLRPGEAARQPTAAEVAALLRKNKFTPEATAALQRIRDDYTDFLKASEKMSIERAQRTVSDPAAQALAIAKVRADYNEYRVKPFFPMTRFGKWTIAVRDLGNPDHPVIWASAYDTRAQRDAALDKVRAAHPGQKITYGTVPEHSAEFLGLPGPMLRTIRDEMPNLSKDQRDWIEEFEQIHAPDNTFRKKWLQQSGLPGYSMDAMRAHSAFFMSGANYLARLTYQHELQDGINAVARSVRETTFTNTAKRQEILNYMQDHYRYIMEAGRDWGKTKAFISLWQLGFSPAAAFVNLLQTPTTTFPHLMGEFGNAEGFKHFMSALDPKFKPSGQFDKARAAMASEGLIDVGQAADLATYAEGHNMLKALAGDKAQQAWMEFSYQGMRMFQYAEHLNRVVTVKAAWEAAMKNPNNKRLTELATLYPKELGDLMDPANYADGKGLTGPEALAYLYAKETVEKTQFTFAKWNRPPFLRSQLAQVLLIFFKYTQNMLELYRVSPGRMQMALVQAALFGLAGMPGAEDLNAVMKSVGHLGVWLLRKLGINLYGQDFDLLDKAREYARNVTQGTVFDKVGPDLFLHGISRYGFGTGLLPEGYGVGMFDASQNGSLGRIVPGLQEGLRGLTFGDIKSGVNDVAQRAAGAGYGYAFTLLKYLNEDPGTFDSKTWEQLLPRGARGTARAWRFANEGLTTRQGGRLVKFDMTDPEDIGAVIGQAAGFNPTKVSQMNDYMQQVRDQLQMYKAEKTMIYGQLDKALSTGNQGAINDVFKAVDDFNRQVGTEYPTMAIKKEGLVTSIRNRIKQRQMQTTFQQGGPVNRATIPVAQKIRENFPELISDQRVR